MAVWLSYSLSDFLLFTQHTYYRQFELYNRAVWPVHVVVAALGLMLLVLLFFGGERRGRAIAGVLAACWLWVAWAFLFERYDTINWAARYFAIGFAVEAILIVLSGVILNRLAPGADFVCYAGIAIVIFALFVQPLFAPLFGRMWTQVEIFGLAPDPTVAATLGALVAMRAPWHLLVIPLLWSVVTGATLWAMDAADALFMPAIAAIAIGLMIVARSRWATSSLGVHS